MKNVYYETCNFNDAKKFVSLFDGDKDDLKIDCFVTGSRTDANGVLLTQKTYQVYSLI